MRRGIPLASLALLAMVTLSACPLPPTNEICTNTGEIQRRGDEIWKCLEMLSEKKDGRYVSRWFKLHTPPAVIPSTR